MNCSARPAAKTEERTFASGCSIDVGVSTICEMNCSSTGLMVRLARAEVDVSVPGRLLENETFFFNLTSKFNKRK